MRLWTLHPSYLDARGLVALWREALLAQKVLRGATKGYKHHPQLTRFRASADPSGAIATYLVAVLDEARRRGYAFDARKIARRRFAGPLAATDGQLKYEWLHLKRKLKQRDPARYKTCRGISLPQPHPLFHIVGGRIEPWERLA
jgi:Pyrimidine dimer DNA glycosylase